jgi:UDP:flavonoid glycosyltransferase YjiC (YdhE family)
MRYKHIFVLSPPFYSHFMPLLSLAKSFKSQGCTVTFGCSGEFKEAVVSAQLEFYDIDISANKNTGMASDTVQPESEKLRLLEFFEATKVGAVETLMTQSRHRKEDMLHNPLALMKKIQILAEAVDVDLWVVDILSYGATLSLYCLELPFITFCPPHPYTIPQKGQNYGVPMKWPSCIDVSEESLLDLREVSLRTQEEFTRIFNDFIETNRPGAKKIDNAFRLVSKEAILYNYLDFKSEEELSEKPLKLYIGHAFDEESISDFWLEKVADDISSVKRQRKILITLGTFLSSRVDVLEKLLVACISYDPKAQIIAAVGAHTEELKQYASSFVSIYDFIPQKALIPYMDLVIHHGGCNTFTETLYYGKPMIILPFSSDQFNIASDAEHQHLAVTLDPNRLTKGMVMDALQKAFALGGESLHHWSEVSKARGADYAVKMLLR